MVALFATRGTIKDELGRLRLADVQRSQRFAVGRVLPPAAGTQPPHEPLRNDAEQGGGDDIGLHPHVGQTRQRGRGVVSVKRREHQVAGLRGLHRDLGCFLVADFAHQYDVGILAKNRTKRVGERELGLFVHLRLVHARDLIFDRVFDRDDVGLPRLDGRDRRTQRGRLAAARGAHHQNHSVLTTQE